MTVQAKDHFVFQGRVYAVLAASSRPVFDASIFPFKPNLHSTATYRGHQATFAIEQHQLVLHEVLAGRQDPPVPFCGVMPTEVDLVPARIRKITGSMYQQLHHPLDFTGSILMGDGFEFERQVPEGYCHLWKYHTFMELYFQGGQFLRFRDVSPQMDIWRSSQRQRKDPVFGEGAGLAYLSEYDPEALK
ncbi:hypothetical protein [Deinococcus misasensis]|uniref:hypothetical protein n=1 Tax=Deinococcus misasensis TaxID=392413 RepID=UPI0005512FCF|nr:hypothetical protein [Deinococcus misasensis]